MPPRSKYFYFNSPFIPQFDMSNIVKAIIPDIQKGIIPPFAIGKATNDMMDRHIEMNILPQLGRFTANFGTTEVDLVLLKLGYEYLFNTILLSGSAVRYSSNQKAIEHVFPKINEVPEPIRVLFQSIIDNLNITKDLFERDITCVSIIQYLDDRPFSSDDYFDTGHEFANYIFTETSVAVADFIISK